MCVLKASTFHPLLCIAVRYFDAFDIPPEDARGSTEADKTLAPDSDLMVLYANCVMVARQFSSLSVYG